MFGSRKSWEMIMMLWSGIIIIFCLRVNMSVAAQRMRDEFNWNEQQKGLLLSSFYWGYALGQIPSSKLAQHYGAKLTFGCSVLIASLLTLLVPAACRYSFQSALLIRALIGLAESAAFPSSYYFFPKWVPNNEKTIMIATFMSGSYLGNCVGFSVSGLIVADHFYFFGIRLGGWPAIFYFFGILGITWMPLWLYLAYETPEDHPDITPAELEYIYRGKGNYGHEYLSSLKDSSEEYAQDEDVIELSPDLPSHPTSDFESPPLRTNSPRGAAPMSLPGKIVRGVTDLKGTTYAAESLELDDRMNGQHSSTGIHTDVRNYHSHNTSTTTNNSSSPYPQKSLIRGTSDNDIIQNSLKQNEFPYKQPLLTTHTNTSTTTTAPPSSSLSSSNLLSKPITPYNNSPTNSTNSKISLSTSMEDRDRDKKPTKQQHHQQQHFKQDVARYTPWCMFLTHPASLVILGAQWICSWTNFMLLSEIPSFLTDDLGFKLEAAGILSVAPYIAQFISTIMFGYIFESCQMKYGWKTRTIRQIAQFIALFGSGTFLISCSFSTSRYFSVFYLILALFCFGASQSGVACAYLDVAPVYSAVLHAVGNAIGAVAGMLAPIVVAYCTSVWEEPWGWRVVFMLTACQGMISLITWHFFQTSDIVPVLNTPRTADFKTKRVH